MSERILHLVVAAPGGRLDVCVAGLVPELSRTRVQALIRDGHVLVDGGVARRAGSRLAGGEQLSITIPPAQAAELTGEHIPLDILFEDANVLIINKPAGMVVHPAAGHSSGTLVHAALGHSPDLEGIGGEVRPGIIHRLDKDTSGLIVIAKNDPAMHSLQRQFKDRQVRKTYLALVDGHPPTLTGRIEAPIGRDERHRQRMAVVPPGRGRDAQTEYRTLKGFEAHTLLELHPETGRTHQLRVHLAFLGCPVTGDRIYGHARPRLPVDRQMLHAWKLALRLPEDAAPKEFVAPLPADFERVLADLGYDGSLTRGARRTRP